MAHSCLPTRSRLLEKGLPIDDTCVHCEHLAETHVHTFFVCPKVMKCWELIRLDNIVRDLWCIANDFTSILLDLFKRVPVQTRLPYLLCNVLKILSMNGYVCKKQGNRVRVHTNKLCGKNLRLPWWNVMLIAYSLITTLLWVERCC